MRWFVLAILVLVGACGASTEEQPVGVRPEATSCGRGMAVVATDYQSTSVSLFGFDGAPLAAPWITSARTEAGLSAALGGDVVVPRSPNPSDALLLLDRFPAGVLTWVEFDTGTVRGQTNVRTGFSSNPQDAVWLSDGRVVLARYGSNPAAGQEPFDEGGDLLVIEDDVIVDRVDLDDVLEAPAGYEPRPAALAVVGDTLFVLLSGLSPDFRDVAASQVVALRTSDFGVVANLSLGGLRTCLGLAVHPAGTELAVACPGSFGGDSQPSVEESGIAIIQLGGSLEVERIIAAGELEADPRPFTPYVAYAGPERLLVSTFGNELADRPRDDALFELELEPLAATPLIESGAFQLGRIVCPGGEARAAGPCGGCWIADADRGLLRYDGSSVTVVEYRDGTGLPPRDIGLF
ncbi:MAG: hypothetical protein AAGA56_14185 [Myxococcota bacterium]